MRNLFIFAMAALTLAASVSAQITIASNNGSSGSAASNGTYGTAWTNLSSISVQAGDILIVAHSANKNPSSNTITAGLSGVSNTFSSVNSPTTGAASGVWLFYTSITQAGTASVTVNNSAGGGVSHATWYYLLRPDSGYDLSIGATGTFSATATPGVTSGTINFNYSSSNTDYFGVSAASINAATTLVDPAGWTQSLTSVTKREIYYVEGSSAGTSSLSVTSTTVATSDLAMAGVVVIASPTPIPEPSTYALWAGIGAVGALLVRRHRQRQEQRRDS